MRARALIGEGNSEPRNIFQKSIELRLRLKYVDILLTKIEMLLDAISHYNYQHSELIIDSDGLNLSIVTFVQ